jgi:NitT/TauT family transport system substrate-binding protein
MHTRKVALASLVVLLFVASCATTPVPTATPVPTRGLEPITLALGYIPSVQFAPFYVAIEKGYFREEGLDVKLRYGFESDLMKLVAAGEIPFVVASGEEVILARAQGLPVTYVMRWYNKFPVAVFAPKEKGLNEPKKLEGRKVGISCLCGASLTAWKALVYAAKVDEKTVSLETIGFTQAAAVQEGKVEAALDYLANGPVQLRQAGREVDVIAVSDYINLPSNGIVTSEVVILERPQLVQKMVRAVLKGLRDTLNQPDEAFRISLKVVPEAGGENEKVNRAIFDESLKIWQQPEPLGASDKATWETAARFMREMGLVATDVDVDSLFTNRFIGGQ